MPRALIPALFTCIVLHPRMPATPPDPSTAPCTSRHPIRAYTFTDIDIVASHQFQTLQGTASSSSLTMETRFGKRRDDHQQRSKAADDTRQKKAGGMQRKQTGRTREREILKLLLTHLQHDGRPPMTATMDDRRRRTADDGRATTSGASHLNHKLRTYPRTCCVIVHGYMNHVLHN
ncbi:hypothetical protein BDN70DRAFT_902042 [Pholiota conissans]|uniref:Secreted protein n=1 Tax=Pholiota conissans TaxID=109636 RepID=A0A9P6CSE6_9AGAR|nr:hypothetical protein BDN70DRAFT_902042 [Pholiota conissans]